MLLPWHNKTTLVVSPEKLWLHQNSKVIECDLKLHSSASQLMADITEQLMPYQQQLKSSALHIVLSNHFVRYAVLPWRDGLSKSRDWLALAENHLRQIYGQKTAAWQIQVALQGYGQPVVVTAIDTPIIEQFDLLARQFQWSLKTVEPAFATVLNHYAKRLNKEAWLLLAEPQRLLLAQAEHGVWQRFSVAMPPAGEEAQQVSILLNQARQAATASHKPRLYLHGNENLFPANISDEYQVERLMTKQVAKQPVHNLNYGYLT